MFIGCLFAPFKSFYFQFLQLNKIRIDVQILVFLIIFFSLFSMRLIV